MSQTVAEFYIYFAWQQNFSVMTCHFKLILGHFAYV